MIRLWRLSTAAVGETETPKRSWRGRAGQARQGGILLLFRLNDSR